MVRVLFALFCVCSFMMAEEPVLYLTSQVDVSEKFVERIHQEQSKIRLVSYRLSSLEVIKALIEAYKRNVSIEVIVDSSTVTKKSPLALLANAGISVFVWHSEGSSKKKEAVFKRMYHSFCVFGEEVSWSGTYSFSLKSKYHHLENALLLKDSKVAQKFLEEFDKIKKNHVLSLQLYQKQKGIL